MDIPKIMTPGVASSMGGVRGASDALRKLAHQFDQDATKPSEVTVLARIGDQMMFFWAAARSEGDATAENQPRIEALFSNLMDGLDSLFDDHPEIGEKMFALHEIKRALRAIMAATGKGSEG